MNIRLLSEDELIPSLTTGEGKRFRDEHVVSGDTTGYKGISLRYYEALHDDPKGYIVIVHGFCEFWGKYHELAWYLWQ